MGPSPSEKAFVAPNHRIPRVIGILNIVFAANLMVCGLCSGFYVALMPRYLKAVEAMQANAQPGTAVPAKDASATPGGPAGPKGPMVQPVQNTIVMNGPELQSMGFTDPRLRAFCWVESLSGIALNLIMLAAGIGLVSRRRWAPGLGVATAGAKVVRLVALYSFFALAIVPDFARAQARIFLEVIQKQQAQQGGTMPAAFTFEMLTKTNMIMYTVPAVGMILFGSIYPLVSIWLLTRPGVRAACADRKAPTEPDEPW
jgi:hypothetical protein